MEQSGPRGSVGAAWVAAALVVVVVLPLGLLITANWDPLIDVDLAISDELLVPGRGDEVDVLRFLTGGGDAAARIVVLAPLAGWLAWQRRWRLLVLVVASGALVGALNELLKSIFDRPRPSYDGTIEATGYSYPSGHASGTAAMVTVLVLVFWPVVSQAWRWVFAALAIAAAAVVGYTRVALGVHFSSDVVAGWCLGVAWVLLLAVVLRVWPGQPDALPARARSVGSER
jgi:membrane-associated phospholipid phosphatase